MITLTRQTREKVHDLYLEWIGEGAGKFFDEMDTKLLPALSRLSQALFASQMALSHIIKVMKDADHETARYFKGDLSRVGLSGMADFGSDFSGFTSRAIPHLDLGVGPIHQVIGDQTGIGGGMQVKLMMLVNRLINRSLHQEAVFRDRIAIYPV